MKKRRNCSLFRQLQFTDPFVRGRMAQEFADSGKIESRRTIVLDQLGASAEFPVQLAPQIADRLEFLRRRLEASLAEVLEGVGELLAPGAGNVGALSGANQLMDLDGPAETLEFKVTHQ